MSTTTSLADAYQSSNYQQGRLLLLSAGRRLWSPSGQTSVCPQRRCTTCISARRSERITSLLRNLHWLRTRFRSVVARPTPTPRGQSGYGLPSVFWRSAVSMAQLRPTSPTVSAGKATGNSRFETEKFPHAQRKIPEISRCLSSLIITVSALPARLIGPAFPM